MLRRARSLSRFRGTTPGRETTPSIYDYGSNNESYEKGSFSTRPNLYTPDVYGSVSRSVRAVSVARSKDIDDEILGPLSNKITGSFNQYQRGQSIGRFDHLKARRPYSAYSTHDFDYFDRYTERIRDKTPIALDSHYTHYRPYYWYHTAPRTFYYSFPYDDWRYRPLTATRSSSYSSPFGNSSYNYRFNDSIDRVSSMKRAMRDLDYTRELRQLRFPTSSSYLSITQGDSLLNRARDEVRRTIDTRVSSSGISRLNNPRDYFGRTFVQSERDDVTDVGAKYNNISRSVDFKPSIWKAEDNLETAYELQAINDDTLDKLYANQSHIKKNRRSLLQENAGVAPRMLKFDIKSRQVRRDVDNALRLVRNLKELKNETFTRLKQPWVFGSYLS